MPFPFIGDNLTRQQWQPAAENAIDRFCGLAPELVDLCVTWLPVVAQRPYTDAYQCSTSAIRIHMARFRNECLVTLSGEACQAVRLLPNVMTALLQSVQTSGTRLDIAYDVKTNRLPTDVLSAGISPRYKTTSQMTSSTGETVYIGSRKSEVMLRIYRYFEPHPRAKLLRFEFELKGETARQCAGEALVSGVAPVLRGLAERIGFVSPSVREWFAGKSVTINTASHKRTLAKTEMWLIKQAAPAFIKLVREGVIDDPDEWVRRYFLGGEHGN